jgi:hypothetical protein
MAMDIQAVTLMATVIRTHITDIIVQHFTPGHASTGTVVIASITRGVIGTTGDNPSDKFTVSCREDFRPAHFRYRDRPPRCPPAPVSLGGRKYFRPRLILFRWRRRIRAGRGRTLMRLELAS